MNLVDLITDTVALKAVSDGLIKDLSNLLQVVDIRLSMLSVEEDLYENYVYVVIELSALLSNSRENWGVYPEAVFDYTKLKSNLPSMDFSKLLKFQEARLSSYRTNRPDLHALVLELSK